MAKRACLHGHFYQPPRENPWTGEVERQPTAGRDHDWNARISRECYGPNGEARVVDADGLIVDIVDNYARMSFDFGPTLLSWLQAHRPRAYESVLAADRDSLARLGRGNAMAQAYHHSILPLADPRDRRTEILWGLADFRRRFARQAEGLWLPECAVDEAVLADCAALGLRFVVLAPGQVEAVREPGGAWRPAAEALPPGEPCLWKAPDGASLALFVYDGELSRAVAFERALADSAALAERLALAAEGSAAAFLATDGESYGHHHPFGEMGLAHLLGRALPERGVEPVNPAKLLDERPPRLEAKLSAGPAGRGTSWSCAHGVERWRGDCGCGGAPGKPLAWRKPLREGLERLRERLAAAYEALAAPLLPDPWGARDAYVELVLDRSPEAAERFLSRHAPAARGAEERSRVLKLLEMQRHSLMMFTSCGWFFDDLARLEPVQVLRYAARAAELARELGAGDFEPELLSFLARAPGADPELPDGAAVWGALVRPAAVGPELAAAQFAVAFLFADEAPSREGRLEVAVDRATRRAQGAVLVAGGRARFRDPWTLESWERHFIGALLPGQRVQVFVCGGDLPAEALESLCAAAARGGAADLPPGRLFLLRDLRPDARERALLLALKRRLARWEAAGLDALEESLPLVEEFRGLNLPLPPGLGEQAKAALGHALARAAARAAEGGPGEEAGVAEFSLLLERARAAGLEAPRARAEEAWEALTARRLAALERAPSPAAWRALAEAARLGARAGLSDWRGPAQARALRLLRAGGGAGPEAAEAARVLGLAA